MMRLYMRTGRRNLALRQYQRCQDALAAELGVPPTDETRRVLAWVVGSDTSEDHAAAGVSGADLAAMLEAAIEAQRALRVVLEELQRRTAPPPEPEIARFEAAAGRPASLRGSRQRSSLHHSA
jgi:DNA-binding SARP family transcriptional activator